MSWASLANNQTVSFNNLQNAVNTGVFTPTTTAIPVSTEQTTKAEVPGYVVIDQSVPSYANKTNNQLVVKQDLQAPVVTELYIYAKWISGIPSGIDELQYQINGGTVFSFGAAIPSSTCDFYTLLGGLTAGDTVTFTTVLTSVLSGDDSTCPSTALNCNVSKSIGSGANYFYITTNPLITC